MADLVCRLPSCLAPQDQLKQLQEILGSLSLQEEKTRASQRHLDQRVNSEVQQSSSLITQLRAMVAEREAKVQQLEVEIGQLSVQVSRALARPDIVSKSQKVHLLSKEISAASSALHLSSLRPHHVLPSSALALSFHLASHPFSHTLPLFPSCLLPLHKTCLWLPVALGFNP